MATRKTLLMTLLVLFSLAFTQDADVTGTWTATIDTPMGAVEYTYEFVAEGEELTGKAISQFGEVELTDGKINGDEISFVETTTFQDMTLRIEYKGTVAGDEINFTRNVGDFATETFVAKRKQ